MAPGVQLGLIFFSNEMGSMYVGPPPGKLVHFHVVESELVLILEYYVFFNLFHGYMSKVLADILHFLPK